MSFNSEQHYQKMLQALQDISTNRPTDLANLATSANQVLALELIAKSVWDLIAGNSTEYTWIDGTLGRVVSTIVYKTGITPVVTQTFAYNANDEVTSITAS